MAVSAGLSCLTGYFVVILASVLRAHMRPNIFNRPDGDDKTVHAQTGRTIHPPCLLFSDRGARQPSRNNPFKSCGTRIAIANVIISSAVLMYQNKAALTHPLAPCSHDLPSTNAAAGFGILQIVQFRAHQRELDLTRILAEIDRRNMSEPAGSPPLSQGSARISQGALNLSSTQLATEFFFERSNHRVGLTQSGMSLLD